MNKSLSELTCCLDQLKNDVAVNLAKTSAGNTSMTSGNAGVTDSRIKSTSVIILGRKTISGTAGTLTYSLVAGTGFTINSSSGTDAGAVSYLVIY
jgi:hypothetical protein